jgi:hypothetical protein
MHKIGFAFGIACFAVVRADTGSATLDLIRVVVFVLLLAEVLTEFVNLYREGDAFIKKFFFQHNFFQLVI